MASRRTRVVIIGAGIAGIGAARMLCRHPGLDVTVIEATDRIGGRIHTQDYGDGIIEIGAQWIHGQGLNPVYQLANEHGLTKESDKEWEQWEDAFFMQDGTHIDTEVVKEMCLLWEMFSLEAEKFGRLNIPMSDTHTSMGVFMQEMFAQYIAGRADSKKLRQQKEALLKWCMAMEKTENGCPGMHDLSLFSWGEYTAFSGSDEVELKRGYQPLLNLLLEDIPNDVFKLGTKVERIFWQQLDAALSSYPVTIQTSSQDVIGADYVIVTCSLGFLKEHSMSIFYPPLPEEKMEAISNLGYGTVNKIYLQFERPFWGEDVTGIQVMWDQSQPFYLNCLEHGERYEDSEWFKGIHGFDVVEGQTNLLCGWIAGKEAEAMEQVSDETVMKICREILERFTKTMVPMPSKIIKSSWGEDPFSRGSYSYVRAGLTTLDIHRLAAPLPSATSPRLMFAGEATDGKYYSTTHGAMLSGEREAGRILNHLPGGQ